MYAVPLMRNSLTVIFMLKAVVDVAEAKAANAVPTTAKTITAKATEKEEEEEEEVPAAAAVNYLTPSWVTSRITSRVQSGPHLSRQGISL